jgi:hypothetical protein
MGRQRVAVDPTFLLPIGPANVCNMKCLRDGTFRNMEQDYHQFITWDVTPLGTFYQGFFRHLGHIGLERFITFMFCVGGRFAAASLFCQNPRDVKLIAQIIQATYFPTYEYVYTYYKRKPSLRGHILKRLCYAKLSGSNLIYGFCTNFYCMHKYRMFRLLRLCGKLSFLHDKATLFSPSALQKV